MGDQGLRNLAGCHPEYQMACGSVALRQQEFCPPEYQMVRGPTGKMFCCAQHDKGSRLLPIPCYAIWYISYAPVAYYSDDRNLVDLAYVVVNAGEFEFERVAPAYVRGEAQAVDDDRRAVGRKIDAVACLGQ
jgi:hypothetical protein